MEVAIGVAMARAAALVTMKHVGLNVAADPLFTAAYTGTSGPLLIVSADDPGMASSQNEQDNRRFAVAAGVPMLEPADAQESYDFTRLAWSFQPVGDCRSSCERPRGSATRKPWSAGDRRTSLWRGRISSATFAHA